MIPGMRRKKEVAVPEVGSEAPEFFLPSAQGGQFRLSLRTVQGPVVVVFYDGESEEDETYFRGLAGKEDEINLAGGSVVGIGVVEAGAARDFARGTGMRSYVLYDYARTATRAYGLLEQPRKQNDRARPAAFIVGGDGKVAHAWVGERPDPEEILAKVSAITGLPKAPPAEDAAGEKPKRPARKPKVSSAAGEGEKPSPGEEVAERRSERPVVRKLGTPEVGGAATEGGEQPKKMTAEERERVKAERRAARAAGKSLKTGGTEPEGALEGSAEGKAEGAGTERPRLSPEEREARRAERLAARQDASSESETAGSDGPDGQAGGAEKPVEGE